MVALEQAFPRLAVLGPMDDIELVREAADAWAQGRWSTLFGAFHADVEFIDDRALITEQRGESDIRRYQESFIGTWGEYEIEHGEPEPGFDGAYYVEWRERGRGKGSGLEVEQTGATVYWIRDGKIARVHSFIDREAAREAAGLFAS